MTIIRLTDGFVERLVLDVVQPAASDTLPIGKLADGVSGPTLRPANATEVLRLLEESVHERLAVEEQDHSFFIIHISKEPTLLWVSVTSDSPIFAGLAQWQARWTVEHPNWAGWTGF